MKKYTTSKDGTLNIKNIWGITNEHPLYNQALGEVERGEAEILPYFEPTPVPLTSEQVRDNALAAIDSYDFGDGRVIQIRTKDRPLIEGAIGKGATMWKMKDNKRYAVTDEDLQSALDSYESQFKAIWLDHLLSLEEGVLIQPE